MRNYFSKLQICTSIPIVNSAALTRLIILSSFLLVLLVNGCAQQEPAQSQAYVHPELLVDVSELEERITTDPDLFLIDAREDEPQAVIPGAVHFSAVREVTDPDHAIQGYLINPDDFARKMSELGLENNSRVVIYDEGNNLASARLFYALDYYGFNNASLLNGGLEAWQAAGNEMSDSISRLPESNFTVEVQEALMCDFDYVTQASTSDNIVIFDARSAAEFSGEDVRAERGGHIPNAVNIEWNRVIAKDGIPYFLPAEQISALLTEQGITPDKEIIPHCQSNVRGSHVYFTLRLMGFDSVRPYEGSWYEYGNRPDAEIIQ